MVLKNIVAFESFGEKDVSNEVNCTLIASEPLYLKLVETIKIIPCNLSYTKQY